MEKYRLFISSDSDGDYNLTLPLHYLGNHFDLKVSDDTFELKADFYVDNQNQFSQKLHDIFLNIVIISNKDWIVKQFKENISKLLKQLYDGVVISPDNFFGGNQDLMISFVYIKQKDL